MSLRSVVRQMSWCVREPLKLLDGLVTQHLQREAVARSVPVWEDRLNEFEAENDRIEPCPGHRIDFDKQRNRWACIYCQKTATLAEYAEFGPHRYSDTEISLEPPYLSWGVDGATSVWPPGCTCPKWGNPNWPHRFGCPADTDSPAVSAEEVTPRSSSASGEGPAGWRHSPASPAGLPTCLECGQRHPFMGTCRACEREHCDCWEES